MFQHLRFLAPASCFNQSTGGLLAVAENEVQVSRASSTVFLFKAKARRLATPTKVGFTQLSSLNLFNLHVALTSPSLSQSLASSCFSGQAGTLSCACSEEAIAKISGTASNPDFEPLVPLASTEVKQAGQHGCGREKEANLSLWLSGASQAQGGQTSASCLDLTVLSMSLAA